MTRRVLEAAANLTEYICSVCKNPAELRQKQEQIREILTLFYSQISAFKFEVVSKRRLVETYQSEITTKRAYCDLLKLNTERTHAALRGFQGDRFGQ